MAHTAYLPIIADRYGAVVRHIFVVGLDLTGIEMRAQIRLYGDVPGTPLVDLTTVTNGNAQGLRLVEVTSDDIGVPTSHVEIVINETTMESLPYAGEVGDATTLAWDWQVIIAGRKRRLAKGEFQITGDGVTGANAAPTNRAAPYGLPLRPVADVWTSARMTFGEEQVTVQIDGADLIAPLAAKATDAAARAEAGRDAAELASASALASSRYYPTKAAGEAATTANQLFSTDDGAGTLIFYRRTSSGSTEISRALTPAGLAAADGGDRVGWQSPGTGATPRTMRVRVRDLPVSPLDFGAVGDGVADDGGYLQKAAAYAALSGKPLDLTPAPTAWKVRSGLDFSGVPIIMAGFGKAIRPDPSGNFPTGYAVTIGDPTKGFGEGRVVGAQILGNLTVEGDRSADLNGVYLKGSWLNVGAIRVNGFKGMGICGEAVWDSLIGRLSVELSGDLDSWALWLKAGGDTFNATQISSIQVEQAYQKGIFADLLRCRVQNIHSERMTILTADEGGGSYENYRFLLSNSSVDQAVIHAREVDAAEAANRVGPAGEPLARLADGSGAPCRITMNGDASSFREMACPGALVFTDYGTGLQISNLGCRDYSQMAPSRRILLTTPAVSGLCTLGQDTSVLEPQINRIDFAFNGQNIVIEGGTIAQPINCSQNIIGNIVFEKVSLGEILDTREPAADKLPITFRACNIARMTGAFNAVAVVDGGYVKDVALASQARVEMINGRSATFTYTGNRAFLTRNWRSAAVAAWDRPIEQAYPAGTRTERVGYSADGSLYQNTGGTNWVKVA
ncbi:hypothetical protein NZL82_15655 [Sphingomonas sanguinis]|uniref:hypothetical protein n=1 Tax=Sphingomonas sp. LC-1 TaxID=3110957 RepID=UPI0021BB903A|nr:hypothetical protein [Sphingomonas sp. LC-1]MCT8003312.1 hypothetical protein [Sphingomonas sp. LC-1]